MLIGHAVAEQAALYSAMSEVGELGHAATACGEPPMIGTAMAKLKGESRRRPPRHVRGRIVLAGHLK